MDPFGEDSDEDEVKIFERKPGNRSLEDVSPLEVIDNRSRRWTRYKQSLKFLWPVRPYFASDGVSRIDQAGCLSFVTYTWVFSYLWSAFKGFIPSDPQWSCSIYDSANVNVSRLEFLWKEELENHGKRRPPSLTRVVWRFIKTRIVVCCFIFFFCLAFGFIGPTCLVRKLIIFAEQRSDGDALSYGLALVFSLFVVELFRVLSYGATWAISYRTGIRARGAVLGLLYKRFMLARGISQKGIGDIINIYANDGQRIFDAVTFLPLVLMGPSVLIGGLVYLLSLLGPWSLLGVGVFVVFDIIQYGLGKTMVKYRKLAVQKTEERVRIMNEILQCMRFIKMNAWEYAFIDKMTSIRNEEKRFLRGASIGQSLAMAAGPVVPVVAAIVTFLAYVLAGGMPLKANEAFTATTVFFVMVFGIRMIPYGMRYCAEAFVALRKIQEYYLMPEIENTRLPIENKHKGCNLVMRNASFAWDWSKYSEVKSTSKKETESQPLSSEESSSKIVLKGIDLTLEKKQLIAICGPVGSGKSSLLQAIIGELIHDEGHIQINGTMSYCAQDPWILNASLRENIIFGEQFENERYYRVLFACDLNVDINRMTAGDQTEVGERGVTLSGGQKARLALARALYSCRDVYLLDDVLAALDANVAEHIFDYAIKGILATKSTLLVTNDSQYLSKCDLVVFLKNGRIVDQGTHDALIARSDDYAVFCRTSAAPKPEITENLIENILSSGEVANNEPIRDQVDDSAYVQENDEPIRARSTLSGADSLFDIPSATDGHLIESEENLGLSTVSRHVYRKYISAMGGVCVLFMILFTFAANVASSVFASAWLAYWLKDSERRAQLPNATFHDMTDDPSLSFYAAIYGSVLILLVITSALKAITFVHVTLKASNTLHHSMLDRIMHATMRWFDTTPSGRVINRFSKDIDELDTKIPFSFETFLQNIFQIAMFLAVIAWVFPYFLVACVPMAIIFGVFVACFRAGIRSLKRAENVSRSPLFSHITTSIQGRSSIHAYGRTKQFNDRLKQLLDANSGAMFMFQSAMRWLAVWLDLLVVLVTLAVSLFLVLFKDNISPAYAAMALAFSIQNVEQEPEWYNRECPAPFDWPQHGRVSFRDVTLKYKETSPAALKSVSFEAKAMQKVGIVGRTGSGKSSLGAALLRLYPLTNGTVSIDGLDISKMGLHELRVKISSIPQDPVLFAGTIRFNLDPVNVRSDQELWSALEKVHLKPLISNMDKGLNSEIVEGGRNLSAGQRQLLCMARALLRHVKVILLDEATSSLDSQMDDVVQNCLNECFGQCTKLIIAHRLNSVTDSDKILYMDNGKVLEFDSTNALLEDEKWRSFRDVLKVDKSSIVQVNENTP